MAEIKFVHMATPDNKDENPTDRHIEALLQHLRRFPRDKYEIRMETSIIIAEVE